jgi:hypothetical protein
MTPLPVSVHSDSLAERDEFEPSVPIVQSLDERSNSPDYGLITIHRTCASRNNLPSSDRSLRTLGTTSYRAPWLS